jgi:GMP synthase (glutamine-hydrolysing)
VSLDVLIVNINLDPHTTEGCEEIEARLRILRPALRCSILHWRDPSLRDEAEDAAGLLLGPNENPFPSYPEEFEALLGWIRGQQGPLLGICGGHQVLALAHGAEIGPVHDVPPATSSYAGMPKVKGMTRARRVAEDPLSRDLPENFEVSSSHVDEVKKLPSNFHLVIEGDRSTYQMIALDGRPVWGVQFHPEHERSGYWGAQLLERWLEVVENRRGE